jgi:hypothetical protein
MTSIKLLCMPVMGLFRRLSDALYVPSQTGSHAIGDQYMGDYASTYVENNNFPEAAKAPFRGIQIHKKISAPS